MPKPDVSPNMLCQLEKEDDADAMPVPLTRTEQVHKLLSELNIEGAAWESCNGLYQACKLFEEYQDIFVLKPGEIGCSDFTTQTIKLIKNGPFKELY